jgi:hypothetical protein
MACQACAVKSGTSNSDATPPAWAEAVLRALLAPRNREAVSGDLLEEYREVALPARGGFRARLWYIRQVASFVTAAGLAGTVIAWCREDVMFNRLARSSWSWLTVGSLAILALLGALVRSGFGPPGGLGIFIGLSIVLGASAVVSARSRGDAQALWRIGLVCGLLVTVVLLTRLAFDVLDPVDPVERFLAQARDDYSEFNYPRRWAPAAAVAAILMGGGLFAAWRTGRIGVGTLGAVIASATGSGAYIALVALGNMLPLGAQDPLGNTPADVQFFGNLPMMLIPVLVMFSTVLGTIGAFFGRALKLTRTAQSHG